MGVGSSVGQDEARLLKASRMSPHYWFEQLFEGAPFLPGVRLRMR